MMKEEANTRYLVRSYEPSDWIRHMAGTTGAGEGSYAQQYADQIKFAVIIVSTVPVLCIYPFIQKYFEKGVMIGAVKG